MCRPVSKSVALIVLDGGTTRDVCHRLQMLALRYRLPKILVMDSGPQLRNLPDHDELTSALSEQGVKMIVMPQGYHFANFSERMIAEVKKILLSLREDTNASVYKQPQSLLELQGKLLLTENLMSLRPILCSTKSQEYQLLTLRQLTQPFLSTEVMNTSVIDTLRATFDRHEIVSQLGRSGHRAK